MDVALSVNGVGVVRDVEPQVLLLDLLRDSLGLTGAKRSCDVQVCGTCTVLVDGLPVSSCCYLAADAHGKQVTTIEGLAERPEFVRACTDNDLVFVGPDADVMARMGDKVQAKAAMREAGVPLVPGTDEATTLDQAKALAPEVGFPVLLKAAAGGGGRGMRLVRNADDLERG